MGIFTFLAPPPVKFIDRFSPLQGPDPNWDPVMWNLAQYMYHPSSPPVVFGLRGSPSAPGSGGNEFEDIRRKLVEYSAAASSLFGPRAVPDEIKALQNKFEELRQAASAQQAMQNLEAGDWSGFPQIVRFVKPPAPTLEEAIATISGPRGTTLQERLKDYAARRFLADYVKDLPRFRTTETPFGPEFEFLFITPQTASWGVPTKMVWSDLLGLGKEHPGWRETAEVKSGPQESMSSDALKLLRLLIFGR